MSVPSKYKELGDFHEYYSGKRTAPYLTIFVGGNHEASNYMFELYYGGWVAPNIYYLGAANVIRYGPLRIAGLSGIWKGYDYRKPHHERLPYNQDDIRSIFHVRELDVRKLVQIRTQVDVGLSHDWPKQVEYSGDHETLFRIKRGFYEDSFSGRLGSVAAKYVFDRLRPGYWFSSHLHVKFSATVQHGEYLLPGQSNKYSAPQSPPSQAHQTPYPFGLDGAVIASMAAGEEDQAGDQPMPAPATIETPSAAESAPSKSTDDKSAETSSVAAPDATAPDAAVDPCPGSSGDTQSRLSAWNNFHDLAIVNERAETARMLADQSDAGPLPEVKHNLTWKRINTGRDGINRMVIGTEWPEGDERLESKKQKTQHEPGTVKNSDEISLSLDSDSDRESPAAPPTGNENKDGNSGEPASTVHDKVEENPTQDSKPGHPVAAGDVPDAIRSQLPASFARSEPAPAPVNEPLPAAISNKTTHFLALDKCLPNRNFLQLVELNSISEPEGAVFERPYRLEYDKEWLAITRVFANDLQFGDPKAQIPADKGDAIYRPLIENEEKWIEENVVKPGKMAVPENFTPTAPFYDPTVPITTGQQPPEYTDPQTAQFCDLIGIENKFHLSDEERQARMDAGPRPDNHWGGGSGWAPRRGPPGRGPGGRGAGRGRGGGRGRGRGRNPRY